MQAGEYPAIMGVKEQTQYPAIWQWLLFVLLLTFNLYQLLTHAMWRDELQTWSIVRESSSLPELLHNIRYDGFPLLWYLLLWGLSFITASPLAMQLFHFVCAAISQLLIMTRSPFSGKVRLAMVAGYYFSFEYCTISRAYVLGVLIIVIFCAFNAWFEARPLAKGALLGLLANASVYGAIASLAFAADELLTSVTTRNWTASPHATFSRIVRFTLPYALLLAAAVAVMIPAPGGNYAKGWDFAPSFEKVLYSGCKTLISLAPLPEIKQTFWNSLLLLDSGIWPAVTTSAVLLLAVWLLLRPSPRYLAVFSFGMLGVWIFNIIKYSGFVRHTGIVLILLFACLWCTENEHPHPALAWMRTVALRAILGINLAAWAIAAYFHATVPFSGSREMAQIIRQSGREAYPVIADLDGATSAVAGYLQKPFYYATNRKLETFIRWSEDRSSQSGPMRSIPLAQEIAAQNNSTVLLLVNYPVVDGGNIRFIARTADAIVSDEVLYLYEYVRTPVQPN